MSTSLPTVYLNKLKELFAAKDHGTHVSSSACVTSINGSKGDVTVTLGTSIPSGAIMWFNLSSAPEGWKVCDGTNGTPNLIGKYALGATSGIGDPVAAGLPDITGSLGGVDTNGTGGSTYIKGAFAADGEYYNTGGVGGGSNDTEVTFKASRGQVWKNGNQTTTLAANDSKVVYGKSNTVTPPSVNLLPCQKI